jgi:hypothetical protein
LLPTVKQRVVVAHVTPTSCTPALTPSFVHVVPPSAVTSMLSLAKAASQTEVDGHASPVTSWTPVEVTWDQVEPSEVVR